MATSELESGWQRISFANVCKLLQGHQVVEERWISGLEVALWTLDDGTQIAGRSEWEGPYSELTPDIDAEPPQFYLKITDPVHDDAS